MRVILAEKPSVGREIAHALGGFVKSKTNRYLTNQKDCIITWAIGHLIELHHPTANDISKLPILPKEEDWQLRVINADGYQDQFDVIKSLFDSPQVKEIVNACDAGREGELIGRLIYQKSGTNKPLKRMWINSMTKDGLINAYKNIKDASTYEGLNQAARCRSKSDWVVGINGSIAATAVMSRKQNLSQITAVGRVKTPVLTMVVHRQREIDNFVSDQFWEIGAKFQIGSETYDSKWVNYEELLKKQKPQSEDSEQSSDDDDDEDEGSNDQNSSTRFSEKSKADAILASCRDGQNFKPVSKVIENQAIKKANAPNLFDLTTLQFIANKKFKYSSKLTLEIVQELYEKHKSVTYPRTDSTHLPSDYPSEVTRIFSDLITKQKDNKAVVFMAQEAKDRIGVVGKHIFDDKKISDHFAIIPTGKELDPSASDQAKKIYLLIVERFKAAFLPPMEYSETERFTFIEEHAFRAVGKTILSKGWKALIEENEESTSKKKKEVILPTFQNHSEIKTLSVALTQGKTTPPKHFTNGTLVRTMQNISRLLKGEQKKALKDCGIGTPATRANIIDELLSTTANNGSAKKAMLEETGSNKYIVPTDYGKQVVEFLEENGITSLTMPEFTADWELELEGVNKDSNKSVEFMAHTNTIVTDFISKLQHAHKNIPVLKLAGCECPECGSELNLEPRFVYCSDTTCRFKIQRIVAHKVIDDTDLQVLIKNKQTGAISGFVKQPDPKVKGSKKKLFSAALELKVKEDGTYHIQFFFPKSNYELACPLCAAEMDSTISNVSCTNKTDCKFSVWRTIAEKPISDAEIKTLIQTGTTDVISGFKSAKGNSFAGKLVINHEEKRVCFSFDGVDVANTGDESKDKCVKDGCAGLYLISGNRYKCNISTCDSWYTSKPKIATKPFSKAQMTKLLTGKTVTHAVKIADGSGIEVNKKAEYYIDSKTRFMRYNILD